MSYLEPFQSVALFENTFRHQLNKKTGKIDERKFVFDKHFGDDEGQLPVVPDLDRVISVGECGVLRDPRGWIFSENLGGVDPVLKIHYLDDAYLKGDPDFVGRSTVPAIADVTTGAIVLNEAWDIPKYFVVDWKKYHKENAPDLYPKKLRIEIDELSAFINKRINAYACGFARSQEAFDEGDMSVILKH